MAEEKLIANAALTAAQFGFPFTNSVLKDFVQQYLNRKGVNIRQFNDNRPGDDWCHYFLLRNPELSKRNSQNVKRCRAELTREVIVEYFENLQTTLDEVPPENIINYDETNITDDPGTEKVIVRRGAKHASRLMDSSKCSTSVMFAASADGNLLPPYIVFKSKYVYPDWVEGGPDGAFYNRTQSGWFDSDIFEDWFFRLALPALRRKEGKKIIVGDNLGSHLSYRVIKECEENNISFVFLPKNSTHICQPLDVAVFRPVKIAWKQILTEWKLHNKGVVPKQAFSKLLNKMLHKCKDNMKSNILAGFEATGISPYNPEKVLRKIKPRNFVPMEENLEIVHSFSTIMSDLTKINERPAITRKRRFDVPPGKSVSSTDLQAEPNEESRASENVDETIDDTQSNSSDSERDLEDMNANQKVLTSVISPSDIQELNFVLVSFTYNVGTKKECEKVYVAQVTKLKKKCVDVKCLRMYRGKNNAFVFPNVEDSQSVHFRQIKYKLSDPKEARGVFIFPKNVL